MKIVGIDLSLTGTGLADNLGACDVVRTSGHKDDTLRQRRARLATIRAAVDEWCEGADLAAIEGPSLGSRYGHPWDRAGAWWLVVDALWVAEVPVVEVAPRARAKYATGNGNSPKADVEAATRALFPAYDPSDDNACDAILLAAIAARVAGVPFDDEPPARRAAALRAVRVPDIVTGVVL